jgi:hypothetical protein
VNTYFGKKNSLKILNGFVQIERVVRDNFNGKIGDKDSNIKCYILLFYHTKH